MISLTINGLSFFVSSKLSVLEACKYVGIMVPRFCYHESLSVSGNCRMCLVEIENSPKPVASCALPVLNNMKIYTDTPLVKKARENVLESLLLNHPLDCPICDQGGECDLQDQTKIFGGISSRSFFNKRGVEDKNFGPLIQTIMTRCIHCTRCVRFGAEIAGTETLGTLNRGGSTEIGNYVLKPFNSEISGNVIELCPVGALTSKPYAFKARPWELKTTENIDVTDSLGSNVYVNIKESDILRITPKINNDINCNIITDKARFFADSLKTQRLKKVLEKKQSTFNIIDWDLIYQKVDNALKAEKKITFIVNSDLDLNSLVFTKALTLQYKNVSIQNNSKIKSNLNFSTFWGNNNINDLKKNSKICFLFATNIKIENAILNSKLRLKYNNTTIKFYGSSLNSETNFPASFINLNLNNLLQIFESKNIILSKLLLKYKNPIFLVHDTIVKRGINLSSLFKYFKKIIPTAIVLNIKSSSNSSAIDFLNIKALNTNTLVKSDIFFLINLDDTFTTAKILSYTNKTFFWVNTHGFSLAKKCNYLLPIFDIFEENKIFINLEGRPQKSLKVISSTGNSRSYSKFLLLFLKKEVYPIFNAIPVNNFLKEPKLFNSLKPLFTGIVFKSVSNFISLYPLKSSFEDFYRSNKQTKLSPTLLTCSQEIRKQTNNFSSF